MPQTFKLHHPDQIDWTHMENVIRATTTRADLASLERIFTKNAEHAADAGTLETANRAIALIRDELTARESRAPRPAFDSVPS